MDIISLGAATKAAMEENKTRKQTLELGVVGTQTSVAKRLEALEASYLSGVKKANEVIIKDTLNIMKAHTRLNAIAQTKKYQMENLLYDDLIDASGVDVSKSSNYTHDVKYGSLKTSTNPAVVLTLPIQANKIPEKVMITSELMSISSVLRNIANKATYTAIGGTQTFAPAKMYDGDTSGLSWDDAPVSEEQGFIATFPSTVDIAKVRVFGHGSYIVQSSWRWEIGNSTFIRSSFTGWDETIVNVASKTVKFLRSSGTQAKDQAITEVEIYENADNFVNEVGDSYDISRDGGVTWQALPKNQLLEIDPTKALPGTSLVLRIKIPANRHLMNYALTWA